MEFSIEVAPNLQAIELVDAMMKNYVTTYDIPKQQELCFVLHELVINAVEAMEKVEKAQDYTIRVHVRQEADGLQMTVVDQANGIPEEQWEQALTYDLEAMNNSDRGRGLFFVQHMVDQIWFEHITPTQFLVGVSKKIVVEEQVK